MSYQQAERAYMQGDYTKAAGLIDDLIQQTPDDPRVRLLRGHIYCYGLQQYDTALSDYESVTQLTEEPSFLDYATQGIETCQEFGSSSSNSRAATSVALEEPPLALEDDNGPDSWSPEMDLEDIGTGFGADSDVSVLSFDSISSVEQDDMDSAGAISLGSGESASINLGDGLDAPASFEDDGNLNLPLADDSLDLGFDDVDGFNLDSGLDAGEAIGLGSGEAINLGGGEAAGLGNEAIALGAENAPSNFQPPESSPFDDVDNNSGNETGNEFTNNDFDNPFGDDPADNEINPFAGDEPIDLVDDNPFSSSESPFDASGSASLEDSLSLDSAANASPEEGLPNFAANDVPLGDESFANQSFSSEAFNADPGNIDDSLNLETNDVGINGNEFDDFDVALDAVDATDQNALGGLSLDIDGFESDDMDAGATFEDAGLNNFDGLAAEAISEPQAPENSPTGEATLFMDANSIGGFDFNLQDGDAMPAGADAAHGDEPGDAASDLAGSAMNSVSEPASLDGNAFDDFEMPENLEHGDAATDFGLEGDGEFDTLAGDIPSIAQAPEEPTPSGDLDSTGGDTGGRSNADFLEEFDAFDDFGGLSDFDLAEDSIGFTSPIPSSGFDLPTGEAGDISEMSGFGPSGEDSGTAESVWGTDSVPSFTQTEIGDVEPTVAVEQGIFAPLENASLGTKRTVIAATAGIAAALGVAGSSFIYSKVTSPTPESQVRYAPVVLALGGGVAGLVGAAAVGEITRRQIRRATEDLQAQFSKIVQGNFNAQATIYSEDELGQLSAGFNQMSRVILATTKDAQRKAEEQEQQKEDLQRQVIRLLDDVEGAARGDLTVQAEVTADVLGAVADSFNLTIQNLREIVLQVKTAATQVNKASSENETFARSLSSDALRQAEELAVTLNSVQVMTDSIQRVADSAREAEEVARTASVTALKGGEAVEKTVAGILQIRETVAETTRKVKRLAESSQEISKIVALISQIASRTNLLALNASIEAARAGEAGRGFAIVADEVRQLADRAAKSSKEIEQIVLQIQGETSSVMVAMEEGTQQVITGTKLAEQAKRSLDDIIQVSNRIDQLVRSITADTVEQTETSRQVAQVMQSVELTAQETSQEAQRVSRSLQNLVGVASDLQTSVERFRVESSEEM